MKPPPTLSGYLTLEGVTVSPALRVSSESGVVRIGNTGLGFRGGECLPMGRNQTMHPSQILSLHRFPAVFTRF
ncbi:hypothetical protein P692DRAFT_20834044 [Suillus brevipes Sb2]|nr:hypothetical protein P692DRAFT_20834044 [Suillus brevipes Sb2]